jgi:hypothetical protein
MHFLTRLLVLLVAVFGALPASGADASYHKHVTALFSKLGCNGGTCHGAVQGQNGFRLSLFAADPLADRERLLREAGGRRVNFTDPDASLILQKASARVTHQGGKRISVDSWEYDLLRKWIAAGAPADDAAMAQVKELRVQPAEQVVKPGESLSIRVQARFADGSTEDVTRFCSFQSLDPQIASANAEGRLEGKGVGDAAIIVRYRARPAMMRVLVPRPGTAAFPDVAANNFIDKHVLDKLRRLNLPPSPLADDATFLRRVSLDIAGELPTPDEVRTFLADAQADKRATKIEELLKRPGHAALWTLKFCDLLKAADFGVYADALTLEADAPRFQAWVRARLEENTPYDQFAERILLATSREGRSIEEYGDEVAKMMEGYAPGRPDLEVYKKRKTLDLYWQRRGADGVSGAMQVAHAFLGLRLECAQCHRHPHDVWQQDDLLSFANFFMRVRRVGFQGNNEKDYPDAAALFKKFNEEGKKLEAEVKKRKDTEGKKIDEDARKAKTEADRLTREIAQLEKVKKTEQVAAKKKELAAHQETLAKAEKFRQELSAMDRRAKLMPEIARRLLQAEVRLKPPGTFAKVTSPIGTAESRTLRLLGEPGALATGADDRDPRELVMEWMRRPDNPYFARAIVNRVWAHYFGRGIIDPPDNLSSFNPATHPELLKELCDGFIKNKYDLRWLHRTIANSRTYQQSSLAKNENEADRANYAFFPMRRLGAEVFLDALNSATGTTEKMDMKYYHWPDEIKTVEVPYPPNQNAFVSYILENFGRPKRNSAVQCDCERDSGASVFQVLTIANHPRVWEKIKDPNGRVAKLLKEKGDDVSRIDELFLATLSRLPTDAERAACLSHVKNAGSAEKGLQGVLWSLLNTREFVVQH